MTPLNTKMNPIILLSSPPVPSLRITTANTGTTISSPPSSPLLSPSALLQELVEKGTAAIQKQKDTRAPPPRQALSNENVWNVLNGGDCGDGAVSKLPPQSKRATDPIVKTSRAKRDSVTRTLSDFLAKSKALREAGAKDAYRPKTKNTRKKGVTKDGQTVAKTTKRFTPTKSPPFVQPDTAQVPSKPVAYEKPVPIPRPPNKPITEPPISPIRSQWPPAKDAVIGINSSPALGDIESSGEWDTEDRGKLGFANMVSEMKLSRSCSRDGSAVPSLGGLDKPGNGLIKRRAIEMVNLPSNSTIPSSQPKASKPKQPRKKPKTITGQATAQYREANAAARHSLLDYFTLEDATAENAAAEKPTRKRKAASERKRDPVPAPVLLSPKAAKRQFDEMECIFGSSSQLEAMTEIESVDNPGPAEDEDALDYMPPSTSIVRRSFLKTLTKDRKGGNKLVGTRHRTNIDLLDVSVVEDFEVHSEQSPIEQPRLPESQLGRGTASKLWDAAARDLDGGLLSVEVVDMSLSNDIPSLPSSPEPIEEISTAGSSDLSEGPAISGHVGAVDDEPVPNLRIEGQSMRPPPSWVVRDEDIPSLQMEGQPANAPQKNGVEEEFIPHLRIEGMPAPIKATRFTIPDTDEAKELPSGELAKTSDHASMLPNGVTASCAGAPASIAAALFDSSATASNPGPRVQSEPSMPDYNAWITTKLKAEVAKYGFKDLKTRHRMVSMLEQCWLAKNKRTIEQGVNRSTEAVTANTLIQRTRSASPSFVHPAQFGGPSGPPGRGYSTTTVPGVSKSRGNRPIIRQSPPENGVLGPPDRGRSPTPRDQSTTNQPVAKQPSISNAPETGMLYPPRSRSSSKFAQSNPFQLPKRNAKKRNQKQNSSSPSSKSASPSRSSSRSPKRFRKMISCIVRDIKPGSEGYKFSHAILMYDPISVEELVEWLNAQGIVEGGFGKHTVTAKDVKSWCISKGICCFSEDGRRVKRKK
ncbi:hypothetical protein C7212DRAFT_288295 [Tuber magnatum]|uniref:Structure-specific endonuclease subunit SLX4 n=1 Tax=Tuber magnatum TaxID=42249 RepID=A0A317SXJ4_9PEZI|nr:hypothetical protein C7212DRAFT_288295 [Tuber magnatum]